MVDNILKEGFSQFQGYESRGTTPQNNQIIVTTL